MIWDMDNCAQGVRIVLSETCSRRRCCCYCPVKCSTTLKVAARAHKSPVNIICDARNCHKSQMKGRGSAAALCARAHFERPCALLNTQMRYQQQGRVRARALKLRRDRSTGNMRIGFSSSLHL